MTLHAPESARPPIKQGTTPLSEKFMNRPEITLNRKLPEKTISKADQSTILILADEGIQGEPRRALEQIRGWLGESLKAKKGEKPTEAIKRQLEVLRTSKDPKDQALFQDFQIAQQQYTLGVIERNIAYFRAKSNEKGATDETKNICKSEIEKLKVEKANINIKDLVEARAKIPGDIPNSFQELGKIFGISEQQAKVNPLGAIENSLQKIAQDKKEDKNFFSALTNNGLPEEGQKVVRDILRIMRGEKSTTQKTKDIVITASGLSALVALAMAWFASKRDQAQAA